MFPRRQLTQWTTQRYIPEDGTLHNERCENLKSHIQIHSLNETETGKGLIYRPKVVNIHGTRITCNLTAFHCTHVNF
jgi:hypothetical protein